MDKNTQAILLLAAQFSRPISGSPTPLTALEYGRFAAWLRHERYAPKDLFQQFDDIVSKWHDPKRKVTAERLHYLLGRGMAMGLAIEKWQSAGIWILTRADSEYPKRLKHHLSDAAPPVLFGVGAKNLLNSGGLAMVGSRNIGDEDMKFTQAVARQASLEGLNLVSGGARGVDELAMLAALDAEGTAIGVLANDLFKSALSSKWRKHIKSRQLALVTPFYPEGRFHVGNAMGRNKYIYALSDFALVVRSDKGKGGTWAGAIENFNKHWVPLFVASPSNAEGNKALASMGATELALPDTHTEEWLKNNLQWIAKKPVPAPLDEKTRLGNFIAEPPPETPSTKETPNKEEVILISQSENKKHSDQTPGYKEFIQYVSKQIIENGEVEFSTLQQQRSDLKQKQIRQWLEQAVDAGVLKRKGRLLNYTLNVSESEQDQPGFNFE